MRPSFRSANSAHLSRLGDDYKQTRELSIFGRPTPEQLLSGTKNVKQLDADKPAHLAPDLEMGTEPSRETRSIPSNLNTVTELNPPLSSSSSSAASASASEEEESHVDRVEQKIELAAGGSETKSGSQDSPDANAKLWSQTHEEVRDVRNEGEAAVTLPFERSAKLHRSLQTAEQQHIVTRFHDEEARQEPVLSVRDRIKHLQSNREGK